MKQCEPLKELLYVPKECPPCPPAEQKKFIGNAVEVNMSRVLCEALARKLMDKAA